MRQSTQADLGTFELGRVVEPVPGLGIHRGRRNRPSSSVVVADVDDVAAMVGPPGAGAVDLWFAAHEAHGALVSQWMRSAVEYIIAVGPIYTPEEQEALTRALPGGAEPVWIVIDAPASVTLTRAQNDPARGLSRDVEFHHAAHRRFRELAAKIPASATFDSSALHPDEIAAAIEDLCLALEGGR